MGQFIAVLVEELSKLLETRCSVVGRGSSPCWLCSLCRGNGRVDIGLGCLGDLDGVLLGMCRGRGARSDLLPSATFSLVAGLYRVNVFWSDASTSCASLESVPVSMAVSVCRPAQSVLTLPLMSRRGFNSTSAFMLEPMFVTLAVCMLTHEIAEYKVHDNKPSRVGGHHVLYALYTVSCRSAAGQRYQNSVLRCPDLVPPQAVRRSDESNPSNDGIVYLHPVTPSSTPHLNAED